MGVSFCVNWVLGFFNFIEFIDFGFIFNLNFDLDVELVGVVCIDFMSVELLFVVDLVIIFEMCFELFGLVDICYFIVVNEIFNLMVIIVNGLGSLLDLFVEFCINDKFFFDIIIIMVVSCFGVCDGEV